MADKKNPATPIKDYTVDHDATGVVTMPGITLLLNRKTFTVTKGYQKPEPTEIGEIQVRTAQPKAAQQRGGQQVTLWDIKQLKSGTDPLGKGLGILFDQGVRQALFLSIVTPPAKSAVPHFLASAAIAPRERLKLWTGLKWDPTLVPSLWNLFVRTGHAELPPPGTQTDIASNRNVMRAALGVGHEEWLLLVRTGTSNSCRGVLALVSDCSMLEALIAAGPFLAAAVTAPPVKKAS